MGERMTVAEFAKIVGTSRQNVYNRIKNPRIEFDYPLTLEKAEKWKDMPQGRPPRR